MEKEFVPYEQALTLKQLGFDEECFSFYNSTEMLIVSEFLWKNSHSKGKDIVAPLYQQVFRWFREKYDLYGCSKPTFSLLEPSKIIFFYYWIEDGNEYTNITEFNTPEEAELECLKKLIEIVKTN